MFIHLGGDTIIQRKSVIGIFDLKAIDVPSSKNFFTALRAGRLVEDISSGTAKSLVLTDTRAYLSPISPGTLKKRTGFFLNT